MGFTHQILRFFIILITLNYAHRSKCDKKEIIDSLTMMILLFSYYSAPCDSIICNNGSCNEGACLFDIGYTGDSCDQFSIVGLFEVVSLRDESTYSSSNGQVNQEEFGVCLADRDQQPCFDLTLELTADGRYVYTSTDTIIFAGAPFTNNPAIDTGNYTLSGNQLNFIYSSGNNVVMTIENTATIFDSAMNSTNGCNRIFQFTKK